MSVVVEVSVIAVEKLSNGVDTTSCDKLIDVKVGYAFSDVIPSGIILDDVFDKDSSGDVSKKSNRVVSESFNKLS